MKYHKIINRTKGSIETFTEDASRASGVATLPVANMVASVVSGNASSIPAQTFFSTGAYLAFQVNFSKFGNTVIKVETTFTGSSDKIITLYLFRSLDDGTGTIALDYA